MDCALHSPIALFLYRCIICLFFSVLKILQLKKINSGRAEESQHYSKPSAKISMVDVASIPSLASLYRSTQVHVAKERECVELFQVKDDLLQEKIIKTTLKTLPTFRKVSSVGALSGIHTSLQMSETEFCSWRVWA